MQYRFLTLSALLGFAGLAGCRFDTYGFHNLNNSQANTNQSNQNTNQNANQNSITPECGNGQPDSGEECDDGNVVNLDGCTSACQVEHGYHCSGWPSVCHAECGDGLIAGGNEREGCDDGNLTSGDGCSPTCEVEPGWSCWSEPSQCAPTCGDGIKQPYEACDDGNIAPCVGDCAADCSRPADVCGDGFTECGEACDDGENDPCTGNCNADCTGPANFCGDGHVACGEACDDGENDPCTGNCNANCDGPANTCGDGVARCGEACDNGDFGGHSCASLHPDRPVGDLVCGGGCGSIDSSGCVQCEVHADCPAGLQCDQNACIAVGNTCDDSPTVLGYGSRHFDHTLENLENSYNGGSGGLNCSGIASDVSNTSGADRVYLVDLQAGDWITAWLTPHGWNGVLYVASGCPLATCPAGVELAQEDGIQERLDCIAPASGTYYLVVDGNDNDGPYDLDVTVGEAADLAAANTLGQLIFTEVLPDPDGQSPINNYCEWFEVYNTTSDALDLNGVAFCSDSSNCFTIDRPLILESGDHLLISRYLYPWNNCGLDLIGWTYQDGGFNIVLSGALLEIKRGGTLIDHIDYDNGWPYQDGRSMYLCDDFYDHSDNDGSGNWRMTPNQAGFSYSGGGYTNYATPGEANPNLCD